MKEYINYKFRSIQKYCSGLRTQLCYPFSCYSFSECTRFRRIWCQYPWLKTVIGISNELTNLKRLMLNSTHYVNAPVLPIYEHSPHLIIYGFYHESKFIEEYLIRKNFLTPNWMIIRPTTI